MSIISETAAAASLGDKQGLKDVLDFLVTEEQLGVTFVTAAIENAPGTPSEAFLPVLRNASPRSSTTSRRSRTPAARRSRRRTGSPTPRSTTAASACSRRSRSSRPSRSAST